MRRLAASRFPGPDENVHLLITPEGQRLELPAGNYWETYDYKSYGPGPFPGGVTRTRLGYRTRGGRQLWAP